MWGNLKKYSIPFIWVVHFFGVIGVLFWDKELFLSLTPMNLWFSFVLLCIHQPKLDLKHVVLFSIIGLAGFFAEFLGVNFGLIFGEYQYGENLGYQIKGVPLMIGVNWVMLTVAFGSLWKKFLKNLYIGSLLGALSMVALDYIIEPSSSMLGFWYWKDNDIPAQNFLGWFLVSLPIHFLYQYFAKVDNVKFAANLIVVQFLFFGVFFIING